MPLLHLQRRGGAVGGDGGGGAGGGGEEAAVVAAHADAAVVAVACWWQRWPSGGYDSRRVDTSSEPPRIAPRDTRPPYLGVEGSYSKDHNSNDG